MNRFPFLIALYGCELLLSLIWYHMVIKKDIRGRRLFYRASKIAYFNRDIILHVILRVLVFDGNEETIALKKKWQYICSESIPELLFLLGIILLSPIIAMHISPRLMVESNGFSGAFFLILVIISINWRVFKEHSQRFIIIQKQFAEIILFLEEDPEFLKKHIVNNPAIALKGRKKLILMVIPLIITALFYIINMFFNFVKTKYPVMGTVICIILIIGFVLSDLYQRRRVNYGYRQKEKDIVIKCFELEKYQNDINCLCKKIGITDLEIDIVKELGINAYAVIEKNGRPTVKFTSGFINTLRHLASQKGEPAMDETFRAILCHELIHIVYQDPLRIGKRARNAVLVALCLFLLLPLGTYLGNFTSWFFVLYIPILILYFGYIGIICDIRYWGQISELRADKKGMKVAEVSKDVFDTYWEFARSIEHEAEATLRISSANFLYKRYKRYIEIEYHPSIERRKQSLKRDNWGIYDYVEQFLLILKWRITGKGWNGR